MKRRARQFEESAGLFEKSLQPEGVALCITTVQSRLFTRRLQAAGKQFEFTIAQSSRVLPKWQVTQMLNPGASSITRPLGEGTLPILLKDKEGKWVETSIPRKDVELEKKIIGVIRGRQAIQINLHDGGANALETELLAPRVNATTLAELETHYWEFTQFISYLAHVGGFILPLALGDTYFALGDYGRASMYYIKVRDYRFLNQTIEKPVIWNKLAHTYLQWGNRLYRDQNITDARSQYEKIVKIVNGAFELSGSFTRVDFRR